MRLRLLLAALLLEACVWRGYERVMTIHLEVLSGMLDKMVSFVEAGRRPTPNDMTEMLYPLERAGLFLLQHRSRQEEESYRRFAAFVERYRELAAAVDAARSDEARWAELRAEVGASSAALRSEVDGVRLALQREH